MLEETYTAQACKIVFECLRLLAFCLRAALTAKLEEGGTVFLDMHFTVVALTIYISSSCEMLTVKMLYFASVGSKKDKDKPEPSQEIKEPPTQQQQKEEEEKEEEEEPPQLQSRVVEDQSVTCTPPASPSEEEEDPLVAASKQPWDEDTKVGRMEKTFSVVAIERILGLLVATLPEELSVRCSPMAYHCCV